jgi:TatD DNase family protein
VVGLVDTHTHLFEKSLLEESEEIQRRCLDEGVVAAVLPNIDLETIADIKSYQAIDGFEIKKLMGLHPSSVNSDSITSDLKVIEREIGSRIYDGIGEIGIDLYWDKSHQEAQEKAFVTQCNWAVEMDLAVSIHSRDATDLCIDLIKKEVKPGLKGVFHCFTGSVEQARLIMDMGMYLGIGGVVTFMNAKLRDVVKSVGLEQVVFETDSPYLAPHPHRGKRNESSYLRLIAGHVSEHLEIPLDEVVKTSSKNARQLFFG